MYLKHRSVSRIDPMSANYDPPLWQMALVLGCLTLFAYSSVLSAGFIWDDDAYILNNFHLHSFEGLKSVWSEPGATPQYYPLVFTVFWVEYHLWGVEPFGYHLVNILLHGANSLLLLACLRRLELPGAFIASCLFAIHPVQVESVAWVTELKNVLSLFFYLLSFYAYWSGFGDFSASPPLRSRLFSWLGSFACFTLALFSKTVSGSLPAAILLIRWWQTGRICWRELVRLLPFFALALVLGRQTARLEVTHVLAQGAEWSFSFAERILIAGRALWFYAGKLFWPYPLIFNYPRWQIDTGVWWQYLFPLAVVVLLFYLWFYRGRLGRGPLASALFFAGTLFPAIGFFNVYPMRFSFVADHFQYSAAIGIFTLCGAVFHTLRQQVTAKAAMTSAAAVILVLSLLTWKQGAVYANNLTLFSDTLAKNPASWFSYSNRAVYHLQAGREDLALADLEHSLEIKPDEADALQTRGVVRTKQKRFQEAIADFDRSVAIRPWRIDYLKNRCVAYRLSGRMEEALADADRVVGMDSGSVDNYLLRATVYLELNQYGRAFEDLEHAQQLDPVDPRIFFNKGVVLAASGAIPQARSFLLKARELGYEIDDGQIGQILSTATAKKR